MNSAMNSGTNAAVLLFLWLSLSTSSVHYMANHHFWLLILVERIVDYLFIANNKYSTLKIIMMFVQPLVTFITPI